MGGVGLSQLIIAAVFLLPIILIFVLKKKLPDNMIAGILLGVLTPIALFYPNDRRGWMYFLAVFLVCFALANTAGQSLAYGLASIFSAGLNGWRIYKLNH